MTIIFCCLVRRLLTRSSACEAITSEADISETRHRWNELLFPVLAYRLCMIQFRRFAIVDIWTVGLTNGHLASRKDQKIRLHTSCANACPDLQSIVIGLISVEISTVAVLVWLCRHSDFGIDVIALTRLHPSVDLNVHAHRQSQVYHMQLLALASLLHRGPVGIISSSDKFVVELAWERGQNGLPVPIRFLRGCTDKELVVLQKFTAERNALEHGETTSCMSRLVKSLNPNCVTLDDPILTWGVEIHALLIERKDVWVTPNDACAWWASWRLTLRPELSASANTCLQDPFRGARAL